MHFVLLLFLLGQERTDPPSVPAPMTKQQALVEEIARSGRTMEAGDAPDKRVAARAQVPAGAPPLLSFRYYEGKQHHRFGDVDLMLDDAGH